MSIAQAFVEEIEAQAPITRRFLERLPEDKLTWKPHEKSMTAGQLAYHLALVPSAIARLVQDNPVEAPKMWSVPQPASRQEVLDAFDESIAVACEQLAWFSDAAMEEAWQLTVNGHAVLTQKRVEFLRDTMLSHWYQHRGQFSVYLRMLDVPVPASFGPSADELPIFMQKMQALQTA